MTSEQPTTTMQDIVALLMDLPTIPRMADLHRAAIYTALSRCNGNRTHAAAALGVSARTIQRTLRLQRMQRILGCETPTGSAAFGSRDGDAGRGRRLASSRDAEARSMMR